MSNAITTGAQAIDQMVKNWPGVEKAFSFEGTTEEFAEMLKNDPWTVLHYQNCWMLLRDFGDDTIDVHWFCPYGAKLSKLRHMIRFLFADTPRLVLAGRVPSEHPTAKLARYVNRGLGAEPHGEVFVLTKERFDAYNRDKQIA